jgi:hypothetical protein
MPSASPSISSPTDHLNASSDLSASTTSEGKVGREGAMVTDPVHASTCRGGRR